MLTVTVLTALAVTGCASTQSSTATGGSRTGITSASASASVPANSGSSPAGGSSTPAPAPTPVDGLCPAQLDQGQYNGRQALPTSIDVDWVLRCRIAPVVGGGRFLYVERSDSDPTALLAALRAPNQPRSNGVCPMMRVLVPYFALVQRDGRVLAPKMPVTGCGMPQTAVLQALNDMTFKVISKKPAP
jgi:hypothetical protein